MKKIAIIFTQLPHGNAQGREALDLVLALSDINQLSVFFMDDGVFHLLQHQQSNKILIRDYIATLGMLELYDITEVYACKESLIERGLLAEPFVIETKTIDKKSIKQLLATQDSILRF